MGEIKVNKCGLCLINQKLEKSHIFPEFLYRPLYDDKHRYLVLSSDVSRKNQFKQKGIKEFLLCKKCEDHLNVYENYVSSLLKGNLVNENQVEQHEKQIVFSHINYKLFKLFQLSLIWRASISNSDEFQNVDLGPHNEIIRNMILTNNPGKYYEYGCLMVAFMEKMKKHRNDLIITPERLRQDNYNTYRFLLGGFSWIYFISSHNDAFRFRDKFITEDGKLTITLKALEKTNWMNGLIKNLRDSGKIE